MPFAGVGGTSVRDSQYLIDNSLRFNDGDSPTLSRTPASTGNRKTWTFSYWIKRSTISTVQQTFAVGTNAATPWFLNYINSDDTLHIWFHDGTNSYFSTGLNKLRDVSAWYHIMYVVDTTQSTASDRLKVYINESEMTWNTYAPPAQNFDTQVNTTNTHYIGRAGNGQYFDGYTSEVHFIDGQALSPTDFGEFDEDSGIWKPIEYTGTYGTNGFKLDFSDSGSLGADSSPNGNNFTPTNFTATDQTTDTPTNNFATLNSVERIQTTPSEGNCQFNGGAVSLDSMRGTIGMPTGKWYWEVKVIAIGTGGNIGIATNDSALSAGGTLTGVLQQYSGFKSINGWSNNGGYGGFTTGDIIGVALDMDSGSIEFYKNGSSQGVAYASLDTSLTFFPFVQGSTSLQYGLNFGNPSFSISSGNADDNGYGNFEYAPPSGYLALCTQNLATELSPTIDDGSQYFNTVLYSGNGSTQSITGVGFQPDWLWIKSRTSTDYHGLFDSNRGSTKRLFANATDAETTQTEGVTSFDSDGFSLGSNLGQNRNSNNFVAWNWLANGGTTSSNTDGSITSTVQANTTAGFSIVTYTGTGSNATIGHGLGVAPKMIICKQRNNSLAHDWMVYHEGIGNTKYLNLNQTNASGTASTVWQNTTPTSSVFSVGTSGSVNESGKNQLAYCFADIEGYSKFGSYTGNGSSDGTFIYTGFKPAFVIIKRTDSSGQWTLIDTTRQDYNLNDRRFHPNLSDAEYSGDGYGWDMLSNGFKQRSTSAEFNGSGASFIYIAFAENPFVSSTGIPVVAR